MIHGIRVESGFTLLEGLIASVILSTSLLGLAAIQGTMLRQNADAYELTRASNLAADIIERIQFNRKNVVTYNNLTLTPAANNCPAQVNLPPPQNTTTTRGDCLQWQALLAGSTLSAVQGLITLSPIPPAVDPNNLNQTTVTVQIRWTGRRLGTPQVLNLITVVAPE
jgi:type IV pilus assembly protein PilV